MTFGNSVVRLFGYSVIAILAGCATENAAKKDAYDIRPDAAVDGVPTGVEWQRTNDAELKAATTPAALAKFVESDAAADALLAQIGPAYKGDPLVLTQIAGVTQLVMCPKCDRAPTRRKVWVAALERARDGTKDGYVRTFCTQQLDICK